MTKTKSDLMGELVAACEAVSEDAKGSGSPAYAQLGLDVGQAVHDYKRRLSGDAAPSSSVEGEPASED